VTVPERVWAWADARESARIASSVRDCANLVKNTP
jgi:hypothetical protein